MANKFFLFHLRMIVKAYYRTSRKANVRYMPIRNIRLPTLHTGFQSTAKSLDFTGSMAFLKNRTVPRFQRNRS